MSVGSGFLCSRRTPYPALRIPPNPVLSLRSQRKHHGRATQGFTGAFGFLAASSFRSPDNLSRRPARTRPVLRERVTAAGCRDGRSSLRPRLRRHRVVRGSRCRLRRVHLRSTDRRATRPVRDSVQGQTVGTGGGCWRFQGTGRTAAGGAVPGRV